MFLKLLLVALISSCVFLAACDDQSDASSTFVVPNQFKPDTGSFRLGARRVTSKEFGVTFDKEFLAEKVEGFRAVSFGTPQDTYVIVDVDATSRAKIPDELVVEVKETRLSMWLQEGVFEYSCVASDDGRFPGMFRLYRHCKTRERKGRFFYLISMRPDKKKEPPLENWSEFVIANCSEDDRNDPQNPYTYCNYRGLTESGHSFSYSVRGENIGLEKEVGDVIAETIDSWVE